MCSAVLLYAIEGKGTCGYLLANAYFLLKPCRAPGSISRSNGDFGEKALPSCPGTLQAQSTQIPCYLVSASPLPVQKTEMIFPFSPLLYVPCPWLVSSFMQELSAMTHMHCIYHNQAIFQLRHLLDMIVI